MGDECPNFKTDGAEVSASVLVEAGASFIRFTGLALLPVTRPTPKRSIFDKVHIKTITHNEIR